MFVVRALALLGISILIATFNYAHAGTGLILSEKNGIRQRRKRHGRLLMPNANACLKRGRDTSNFSEILI